MPKKNLYQERQGNPRLVLSKSELKNMIEERIKLGHAILKMEINSIEAYEAVCEEENKWHKYNVDLLKHSFDQDKIANEYNSLRYPVMTLNPTFQQKINSLVKGIKQLICGLESIIDRLNLFDSLVQEQGIHTLPDSREVFIVHGHDEALKGKVARFIQRLELTPIILEEQPNSGQTVIEKFEKHAGSIRFAVILLTPDDIGYSKDHPEEAKPRARQNAIAELGYFVHALGRRHVAVICMGEIEIPSNFSGVLYLQAAGDSWELKLAKEMKSSGLHVDLNKLA